MILDTDLKLVETMMHQHTWDGALIAGIVGVLATCDMIIQKSYILFPMLDEVLEASQNSLNILNTGRHADDPMGNIIEREAAHSANASANELNRNWGGGRQDLNGNMQVSSSAMTVSENFRRWFIDDIEDVEDPNENNNRQSRARENNARENNARENNARENSARENSARENSARERMWDVHSNEYHSPDRDAAVNDFRHQSMRQGPLGDPHQYADEYEYQPKNSGTIDYIKDIPLRHGDYTKLESRLGTMQQETNEKLETILDEITRLAKQSQNLSDNKSIKNTRELHEAASKLMGKEMTNLGSEVKTGLNELKRILKSVENDKMKNPHPTSPYTQMGKENEIGEVWEVLHGKTIKIERTLEKLKNGIGDMNTNLHQKVDYVKDNLIKMSNRLMDIENTIKEANASGLDKDTSKDKIIHEVAEDLYKHRQEFQSLRDNFDKNNNELGYALKTVAKTLSDLKKSKSS